MPTVLVRAMKPFGGALLVADRFVQALLATNTAARVAQTPD
jgi:hypothetical protein